MERECDREGEGKKSLLGTIQFEEEEEDDMLN